MPTVVPVCSILVSLSMQACCLALVLSSSVVGRQLYSSQFMRRSNAEGALTSSTFLLRQVLQKSQTHGEWALAAVRLATAISTPTYRLIAILIGWGRGGHGREVWRRRIAITVLENDLCMVLISHVSLRGSQCCLWFVFEVHAARCLPVGGHAGTDCVGCDGMLCMTYPEIWDPGIL